MAAVPFRADFVPWYAFIAAKLLTVGILVARRLVRRYPLFTAWLLFVGVRDISALLLNRIQTTWLYTEPVVLLLQIGTVLEAFSRLAANYPGRGNAGRYLLVLGLGVASGLAILTMVPDVTAAAGPILWMIVIERYCSTVMTAFCGITALAYWLVPISVQANIWVHFRLLTAYLMIGGITAMLISLLGPRSQVSAYANQAMTVAFTALLCGWMLLLTSRGEYVERAPQASPEELEELRKKGRSLIQVLRSVRIR